MSVRHNHLMLLVKTQNHLVNIVVVNPSVTIGFVVVYMLLQRSIRGP